MRKLEKSKDWTVTLSELRQQLSLLGLDQDRTELANKIANLERAIAIKASLSASTTPRGKIEFSL